MGAWKFWKVIFPSMTESAKSISLVPLDQHYNMFYRNSFISSTICMPVSFRKIPGWIISTPCPYFIFFIMENKRVIYLVIFIVSQEAPLFLARTLKVAIGPHKWEASAHNTMPPQLSWQMDICIEYEHKKGDYLPSLPVLCLKFNFLRQILPGLLKIHTSDFNTSIIRTFTYHANDSPSLFETVSMNCDIYIPSCIYK